MDTFILVLEIIGTIAFAISGAMTGIKKNMDIFGIVILGLTTAVGGGVIRDIILGITPPKAFQNPVYAIISIIAAIIILFPVVRKWLLHNSKQFKRGLFFADTLGLGIFTVMGIYIAYGVSTSFNAFLLVFVGVITGVGGGVLRDIFAGSTPYIFVKHIYASASMIGAIVCLILWNLIGSTYSMLAGVIIIIVIRIVSAYYNLNLPSVTVVD